MRTSSSSTGSRRIEGRSRFAVTHWSVVLTAGRKSHPEAQAALATLCETYWYPLYAYLRRDGRGAEDAADLTQGFFARLLEKSILRRADPKRGRFRSFLLTSMKHYAANERRAARAAKRGGATVVQSLDPESAETRYRREPADDSTPEQLFDRRWALSLLETVLQRLRQEYVARGKSELFDRLKPLLTGDKSVSLRDLGRTLDMDEGAVKVASHRLRKRYREMLLGEIRQTLDDPDEAADELRCLFSALGAG